MLQIHNQSSASCCCCALLNDKLLYAVIHAGIYYAPGSLKARLCVRGKALLYDYARERDIAHKQLGKVIVCSEPWQLEKLEQLHKRAHENGVTDCVLLTEAEVKRLEPNLKSCGGMLSPSTGIIDSHGLMECLQGDLQQV
jgi:L-2-hydroxyglutarate oxidase LhgO